jgi:uncharacterized damage-inducible protein DinB
MISDQLNVNEYNPYYKAYIDMASDEDILKGLKLNLVSTVHFLSTIPLDKHDYAYAEGKWTIKEILLHIMDTERIFTYRALRIARSDSTPLPGFDQDKYVVNSKSTARSMDSLIEEYEAIRYATLALYKSFDTECLRLIGKASASSISVRALGYIITGHENHHYQIIKEHYL